MKRIHNLLADIDTAWAQGNIGDTEAPVKFLIELVGIMSHKIEKLETRTNRLERKHTANHVDVQETARELKELSEVSRLAVEGVCDRLERLEAVHTIKAMNHQAVERMEAGESLKPADDE